MPSLLTSVLAFQNSILGYSLQPSWIDLPDGALDRAVFEASREAETFCDRVLAAPKSVICTWVANAVGVGALTVPTMTTTGFSVGTASAPTLNEASSFYKFNYWVIW